MLLHSFTNCISSSRAETWILRSLPRLARGTSQAKHISTSATDQCSLVDQMMTAMKDTTDILDHPDNNAHINCIRAKSDDEVEEKAWEVMVSLDIEPPYPVI